MHLFPDHLVRSGNYTYNLHKLFFNTNVLAEINRDILQQLNLFH